MSATLGVSGHRIRFGGVREMVVLAILLASWVIFRAIGALGVEHLSTWQESAAYALALMFVFTGIAHFNRMKHDLVRMVPGVFPSPMTIVQMTGVFELLGALGLALPQFRRLAAYCLIVLMVALFPANVKAALESISLRGKPATPLALRAPMQILFIGLLWWVSRI